MCRTVLELIKLTDTYLRGKGVDSPRLDAELLLAHVLGCARIGLYTAFDRPLTEGELADFRALVRRRGAREPCAYLTGRRWFYTHELEVTPDVLIPRPETETLVEVALESLDTGRLPDGLGLDLGTGSGAIAVVVCAQRQEVQMVASDCSLEGLQVAARNIRRGGLEDRISLVCSRGFSGLRGRFAWICSNPPYVPEADRETIMPEVVKYEPELALFSGGDGLELLREILIEAPDHLLPGGVLAVECDPRQVAILRTLGQRFGTVRVIRDLAGRERVVEVTKR